MTNEEKLVKFLTSEGVGFSNQLALEVVWYIKRKVGISLDSGLVDCNLGQVQNLMEMLTICTLGEDATPSQPSVLGANSAFGVILYLQEELGIIPDNFEMCATCNNIFDYDVWGHSLTEQTQWHKEHGITPEMIESHQSIDFCDMPCEVSFWDDVKAKVAK